MDILDRTFSVFEAVGDGDDPGTSSMIGSASMSSISIVSWYFTLEHSEKQLIKERDRCALPPLIPGFKLNICGIETENGLKLSKRVCAINDSRTLLISDEQEVGSAKYSCKLIGQLYGINIQKAGFQPDFISEFQHGFPANWLHLFNQHIQSLKKAEMEVLSLVAWRFTIKPTDMPGLFEDFVVNVYGIRTDTGDQWVSSPITAVVAHNLLQTSTRRYRLVGEISREESIKSGLAEELVDAFATGFPYDWRPRIQSYVDFMKRVFVKKILDSLPVVADDDDDEDEERDEDEKENSNGAQRIVEILDESSSSTLTMGKGSRMPQLQPIIQSPNCTLAMANTTGQSPLPPPAVASFQKKTATNYKRKKLAEQNSCVDFPLKMTSSGRLIKPRINSWLGERVVYDVEGNVIGTRCATTMYSGQNESSKILAIASHCGLSKVEHPKQITDKPMEPMVARPKGRSRNNNNQREFEREASLDSYTKKLDAMEFSDNDDGENDEEVIIAQQEQQEEALPSPPAPAERNTTNANNKQRRKPKKEAKKNNNNEGLAKEEETKKEQKLAAEKRNNNSRKRKMWADEPPILKQVQGRKTEKKINNNNNCAPAKEKKSRTNNIDNVASAKEKKTEKVKKEQNNKNDRKRKVWADEPPPIVIQQQQKKTTKKINKCAPAEGRKTEKMINNKNNCAPAKEEKTEKVKKEQAKKNGRKRKVWADEPPPIVIQQQQKKTTKKINKCAPAEGRKTAGRKRK